MKVDEVLNFFDEEGRKYVCAEKIGFSRTAIYNWIRKGYIPIESQVHISKLSGGNLTVDSVKKEIGSRLTIEKEQ